MEEIKQSVDETVKQFLDRHRDSFQTYGDALTWLHETEYNQVRLEAGKIGRSAFSNDILWLIARFGPNESIDFTLLKPLRRKKTPDPLPPEKENKEVEPPPKKRGRPRKKVKSRN